jgi:hypothetical protein
MVWLHRYLGRPNTEINFIWYLGRPNTELKFMYTGLQQDRTLRDPGHKEW